MTSSVLLLKDKPLKHLNKIAERSALDIEFQDLKYSVRDVDTKQGWRQILNSISGKFCCGEMTAILGPSGAGKTTLLNILAGYIKDSVKGNIKINNSAQDIRAFKKMLSYIMQDNIVQPRLTVKEAVIYAASLKLGSVSYEDKVAVVEEVIDFLGLEQCMNTRSEHLSGGERKRLTIALELVSNPPVIFLDEPTTGLDDFAAKQCIDMLKKISQLDRTVIFTIHQPSSSHFQYFDQVYIIAGGYCVYNGSPNQLIPFLSSNGYPCPSNYTPSDYIMEQVHLFPSSIEDFRIAIQNGKDSMKDGIEKSNRDGTIQIKGNDKNRSTSCLVQFSLLLSRIALQTKRNRMGLFMQFIHHFLCALLMGVTFYGIGNDASHTVTIFKFCLCCNVFFSYTYVMGPVLTFPFEIKLMKREHFNGWYDLKAYYFALTVSTLPLLIVFSSMYTALIYFMTDQPKDGHRFMGFYMINLLLALTSESLGYLIGSLFNITKGAIIGSTTIASLLVIACYGLGYKATNIFFFYRFLINVDFLRNGVIGLLSTLFYERKPLDCKTFYCHYSRPDLLARDNAIPLLPYKYHLAHLLAFLVVFRVIMFLALKYRLNYEFLSTIIYYGKKIILLKF